MRKPSASFFIYGIVAACALSLGFLATLVFVFDDRYVFWETALRFGLLVCVISSLAASIILIQKNRSMTIEHAETKNMLTEGKLTERRLKEIQQQYHSLFTYNLDFVFLFDRQGQFLDVNPAAERITGYSKDELLKMTFLALIPAHDHERSKSIFQCTMEGTAQLFEITIVRKDEKPVVLTVCDIPYFEDQQVKGVIGIAKNITEERKAQLVLDGHNQILQQIAQGTCLQRILHEIILFIEKQSGSLCSILLADDNEQKLRFGAAPSLPDEYNRLTDRLPIQEISGSCGTAAFLKKLVIAENIETDPNWIHYREIPLRYNLRACWSLPIIHNDRVLGTFGMYSSEPKKPTPEDIELLEKAANLARLAIERSIAGETIRRMAYQDALTGLPNRAAFHEALEQIGEPSKQQGTLALLYIDLDRFKSINDSFGHSMGDLLLQQVSERLISTIQEGDTVYHLGGDEFAVLLQVYSPSEAEQKARRIIAEIESPFMLEQVEYSITASVGISVLPAQGNDRSLLLKSADAAMLQAKRLGKNNVQLYHPDMNRKTQEELDIELYLKKALLLGEFTLHYQPLIDLTTNLVVSAEALIRWNHPKLGLISPSRFIPVAEQTGYIVSIGEWVLYQACLQCKEWNEKGISPIHVSVNLSPFQFKRSNLAEVVRTTLQRTGLHPQHLQLEITESMMMDALHAKKVLNELKQLGVSIAIDDFGTGYSSLSMLNDLPIDRLKIDKSFLSGLDATHSSVIKGIIAMAHSLHLQVTAEGIETVQQAEFLRRHECDCGQGYLFSRPLPAADFAAWCWQASEGKEYSQSGE